MIPLRNDGKVPLSSRGGLTSSPRARSFLVIASFGEAIQEEDFNTGLLRSARNDKERARNDKKRAYDYKERAYDGR
ncbi:MAG: hypothetical protein V4485_01355 [Pseudomonadota bacterium]